MDLHPMRGLIMAGILAMESRHTIWANAIFVAEPMFRRRSHGIMAICIQNGRHIKTRGKMNKHTCIGTLKEIMQYQITCAECGLTTETDSEKWTPAKKTFECPRCKATYPIAPHAKAKGEFWG